MHIQETFIAVILFTIIFLFGYKITVLNKKLHRCILSFAAGIAVAYVFIHLLPELQIAKKVFVQETAHSSLFFPEHIVYLAAMFGFILSYGLERMISWSRVTLGQGELSVKHNQSVFLLHLSGYAIYVWLVSYLMIRNIEVGTISIALYTIAMGFHFLGLDFYFYEEYGQLYTKLGKYILAIAAILGWGVGMLTELHKPLIIVLLGLISGAIIMNSMIMELPQGKAGKFFPFLLGGVFYAALLLSVG